MRYTHRILIFYERLVLYRPWRFAFSLAIMMAFNMIVSIVCLTWISLASLVTDMDLGGVGKSVLPNEGVVELMLVIWVPRSV